MTASIKEAQALDTHEVEISTIENAGEMMRDYGIAYIPGFVSQIDCAQAIEQLDAPLSKSRSEVSRWYGYMKQVDLVEDRQASFLAAKLPAVTKVKDHVASALSRSGKRTPEMKEWVKRVGNGKLALPEVDVFKYKDGTELVKHIDVDEGEFPSQALITLRGGAVFDLFDTMDSETPRYSIQLSQGDLVLLRGNEFKDKKQLPHAVRQNTGERVVMALYPSQSYESDIDWQRAQQRNGKTGLIRSISRAALSRIVR